MEVVCSFANLRTCSNSHSEPPKLVLYCAGRQGQGGASTQVVADFEVGFGPCRPELGGGLPLGWGRIVKREEHRF
jgi:hypothetical protein